MAAIWTAISTIWTAISTWLVSTIGSVQNLFWDATANSGAGELTFIGVLSVIALGIGVIFLLIGFIQNFLHLRS